MGDQNPYEQLGVREDASFDEIQDAKGRLMQEHRGNQKLIETVEAAYDAIIMDRLKMRQEGKIKVPERIRFPERERVSPSVPTFTQETVNRSPAWLQGVLDTPTQGDLLWPAVSFLLLSAITVFYPNPDSGFLSLVIALGVGCNIYFLNRKERQFWRAVLLTLLGLLVGVGLGSVVSNGLQAQITSLNLINDQVATLVTFFVLWLISSFLR